MNDKINTMLTRVRSQLEAEEAAWGPEQDVGSTEHEGGRAGTLGASNITNIVDTYNAYFDELVDTLMSTYDCSEEEANSLIDDVIEELQSEGLLDEEPDDNTPEEEIAVWLGRAKSAGLQIAVGEAAKEVF